MTQAGCYQLVLDRKLGEYRLPDGWVVIAAGNPASERGVHFSMPRPLRNRFVHLDLEPDFEDWCQWAVKAGIRPEIVAFLRFKPALLHDADATRTSTRGHAAVLGDGFQCVDRICARQNEGFSHGTTEIEAQLLEGTIGPAATTELIAFLRLFRQLPSIDEILLNPDSAPFPTSLPRRSRLPRHLAGAERSLHCQGRAISRPHADRNARPGHARCGSAGSRHHPYAGVRSLRRGTCGGSAMITERAMLAAVHISIWTAVKHDRKVSRDVASQHGAPRAPAATTNNCSAAQRSLTLCGRSLGRFGSTSTRSPCPGPMKAIVCCPHTSTSSSRHAMREFEQSFSKQVDEFLDVYPSYIEQVRPELNGLFREEDYPSADKLRNKFGVKLEVLPIPSGDDFRVTLSPRNRRALRGRSTRTCASRSKGNGGSVGAAEGRGHPYGRPAERTGVAIPCVAGDQCLRPGRPAAAAQRQPGPGAEPLCGRDQEPALHLPAHELKKNDILRVATASDAAALLDEMDTVMRQREQARLKRRSRPRLHQVRTTSSRTCRPIWRRQPHEQTHSRAWSASRRRGPRCCWIIPSSERYCFAWGRRLAARSPRWPPMAFPCSSIRSSWRL